MVVVTVLAVTMLAVTILAMTVLAVTVVAVTVLACCKQHSKAVAASAAARLQDRCGILSMHTTPDCVELFEGLLKRSAT